MDIFKDMRPVIFSCQGPILLKSERDFFERCQPLGFILFERNCKTPDQVKELISQLRGSVEHDIVPILIDQEGGRVVRLRPPYFRTSFPASLFGNLAKTNLGEAKQAVFDHAYLTGVELKSLGITVNCSPCADLLCSDGDSIIGDRAFSHDVVITAELSIAALKGFFAAGIMPVIKHLPGHGHAPIDSHKALPMVKQSKEELMETDFAVFRRICHDITEHNYPWSWGMTAHVVYRNYDPHHPATQSDYIINQIIRRYIDFKGPLITDCLTMEALKGSMRKRAIDALSAGCDIVLHCSGSLDEMIDVCAGVNEINFMLWKNIQRGFQHIQNMKPSSFNQVLMEKNLEAILRPLQAGHYLNQKSLRS